MNGENFVANSTNEWIQSFPFIIILCHMIGFMKVHDQVLMNQRNQNKTHGIREFLAKTTLVFLHLVGQACLQLGPFLLGWNIPVELPPPPNTTRCSTSWSCVCVTVHLAITITYCLNPEFSLHKHKHNVIITSTKYMHYELNKTENIEWHACTAIGYLHFYTQLMTICLVSLH